MQKPKHFTLQEFTTDSESPMIGTVTNIENNTNSLTGLKDRFVKAIGEHFDIADFELGPIPDLFDGAPSYEIKFRVDNQIHKVSILETWLY